MRFDSERAKFAAWPICGGVSIESTTVCNCARLISVPATFAKGRRNMELRGSVGCVYDRAEFMSVSRQQGWTCFLVNQLACPGVGTIMAGRRVTGFVQAGVMIVGFCATLAYGLMYLSAVYKWVLDARATQVMHPPAWLGIGGFALCVVAWFWSLFSSFQILNESRRHQSV